MIWRARIAMDFSEPGASRRRARSKPPRQIRGGGTYREKRKALFLWQQRFLASDETDAPSIRAAVDEMRGLVEKLNAERKWTWLERIFSFFKASSGLAKLAADLVGTAGEITGAAGEMGGFVADLAHDTPPGIPAAALVVDARKRLGVTS